ncbi:MAG: heavy-metal-associated domain-containing protein [Prevotellaceae bacterium]|jgi:copper chaperone CopZ|nr:heavy-metal-associated domain-containing protein [Prevotellaceae bacterium]
MSKTIILALALLVGLTLSAQENEPKKKKSEKVTFAVNMYCENCKTKIEKNISWEKGVKDLAVNLEMKTVDIVYNPQKTTEENLKKAIEKLGYTAEKVEG